MLRILLVLSLISFFCGCSDNATEKESTRPRVAFVTNNASDFWSFARRGTEVAAREFGVDVEYRIPQEGTAEQQQQIIEDLVTLGIQGLAISPVNPAHQGPLLAETSKRVPLITHDSDAPGSARLCYVGTNNVAAGLAAGAVIKSALPNGGRIMLFVGSLEAANARERRQGILEALKDTGISVIDTRTDKTDRSAARVNAEQALVDQPDLAAMVGLWSYNGPAILDAVRAAKRVGKVKIVCFDEEEATLQGIQDGDIVATVVQQPYEFGYQSVRILAALAQGKREVLPEGGILDVPTLVIDRAGLAAFRAKLATMSGAKR